MHDGGNLDRRFRQTVHQAVSADEEFTYRRVVEFRDYATAFSERLKRSGRVTDFADKGRRIVARVNGDVVRNLFKVVPGGLGPDYSSSQRAIRRSTSS